VKYQIEPVVVLSGLKPAFLSEERSSLIKSYSFWSEAVALQSSEGSQDALFQRILAEYGSRFYQQEILNATKAVKNCSFFIAPFLATPQLVQFFSDQLVHVVFGSAQLLAFEPLNQAIVNFDLDKNTFSFIDREDLKVAGKNVTDKISKLADFLILSGSVYNKEV